MLRFMGSQRVDYGASPCGGILYRASPGGRDSLRASPGGQDPAGHPLAGGTLRGVHQQAGPYRTSTGRRDSTGSLLVDRISTSSTP